MSIHDHRRDRDEDEEDADGDSATAAAINRLGRTMSAIDDSIQALTDRVATQTSVDASAVAALNGIAQLLKDALAAAAAAGATPAQLQSLTDLSTAIGGNNTALADAVTANTTPPAPAPSPAPAPAPTPAGGTAAGAAPLDAGGAQTPTGAPMGGRATGAGGPPSDTTGAGAGPAGQSQTPGNPQQAARGMQDKGVAGVTNAPGSAANPGGGAAPGVMTSQSMGMGNVGSTAPTTKR